MTNQKTKQIPKGWKEEELGEVAEFKRGPFGSSVQKSECITKGKDTYKLYEQGNVINNDFNRGVYYLSEKKFKELEKFEIKTGDILITCAGTLGKIAIVPEEFERGIINSVLMRIRIDKNKINRDYFIYFFKSSNVQNDIQSKSAGVAVKNLFATRLLKKFQIPLPPLPLQSRIVSAIETQFTRLDNAVNSLKTVKQKIQLYRKAVLKRAFENFDKKKIKEISKNIQYGLTSQSKIDAKGLKYLRITDIQKGKVNWEQVPYSVITDNLEKYILNEGDIVFARTGATVGKSFLIRNIPEKSVFASYLIRVVSDINKIIPELLYYYFQSPMYWQEIGFNQRGIGQPNVNGQILSEMKVPLPDLKTQQKIISAIESSFSVIDKVEEIVDNSLKKTEQLRKSILKVAFEGRLVK
ncbi:MAG: restriction endonuclease subunit S [Nanoarchaeota archaeon]|nr:restriction endonuclease subunit S [Nanoarchaeota archaeon]